MLKSIEFLTKFYEKDVAIGESSPEQLKTKGKKAKISL